ncbi:aminoacyl-tRNA hydrolase [Spirochaetota bacterium]
MIKIYAFLGNHGREYAQNRHNVAWQFLEQLSIYSDLRWHRGFKGRWAQHDNSLGRSYFICPETYMNLSGNSVAELASFYKAQPEEILAVHDELELGFGFFGFKAGGGLGGHNGLRSLKERLGSAGYMRLRFGIGRPDHDDVSGYVLSDFSREEKQLLQGAVFPQAEKALYNCMEKGIDEVLLEYRKTNALSAQDSF